MNLDQINAEIGRIYREHQLHPALVILRPWPQDEHLGMQIARRVLAPPRIWFDEVPTPEEVERLRRLPACSELFDEVVR